MRCPLIMGKRRRKTFDLIQVFRLEKVEETFGKCLTKNAVLGRLPLGRGATAAAAAANFRNDAKNRLRRRRLKDKA